MEAVLSSIRHRVDPGAAAFWAAGLLALLVVFAALGLALGSVPLPMPIVLGFGAAVLGTLTLALTRYEMAIALGIVLLAVVRIEPAPSDLVFAVVIALAFVTVRFRLERVPISVTILVSGFLALNLLASIGATDGARAVNFFAITLYLSVFGVWLASYVSSVSRARLVLLAYLTGAGVTAALACLALFAPFPGADALVVGPRVQGLFKDPNVFGPFLVPAALIVMEETVAPRLLRFRALWKLALLSVLTVGIVFSFSRAAWL